MGGGEGGKLLGKARLRKRQVGKDIDKVCLFVGIVAVEGLLRGNARLRQNGIDARRQVPLLKKELVGGDTEPLAGLLDAPALSMLHCCWPHFSNVLYVTIIAQGNSDCQGPELLRSTHHSSRRPPPP